MWAILDSMNSQSSIVMTRLTEGADGPPAPRWHLRPLSSRSLDRLPIWWPAPGTVIQRIEREPIGLLGQHHPLLPAGASEDSQHPVPGSPPVVKPGAEGGQHLDHVAHELNLLE